jgi:hypothetical protein
VKVWLTTINGLESRLALILGRVSVVLAFSLIIAGAALAQAAAPVFGEGRCFALLIGNKTYARAPAVDYAHNDTAVMRDWLTQVARCRVEVVHDATGTVLRRWFGRPGEEGDLHRRVRATPGDVFVFYSGHGAPDPASRAAHLVAVDADPERADENYAIADLEEQLVGLRRIVGPSRRVVLMLDACFSGQSPGGSILRNSASFVPVLRLKPEGVTRIMATQPTEVAYWDEAGKLGLLTSRFMLGVAGLADHKRGTGNGDSRVSWSELKRWLEQEVPEGALGAGRQQQNPQVDDADLLLPRGGPRGDRSAYLPTAYLARLDTWSFQDAERDGRRAAYEEYLAECSRAGSPCAHRAEADRKLASFDRADAVESDRLNWNRRSEAGDITGYLTTCAPVCAYREPAERRLRQQSEGMDAARAAPQVEKSKTAPPVSVAHRVFMLEQVSSSGRPEVRTRQGEVTWRVDSKRTQGQAPSPIIRGTIRMVDGKDEVEIALYKNDDPLLAVSHLIEISFKQSADNDTGAVREFDQIEMRVTDTTPGIPLASLQIPIQSNVFLFGLLSGEPAVSRNMDLLRNRDWVFFRVGFANNKLSAFLIEKGSTGRNVFHEVFSLWQRS